VVEGRESIADTSPALTIHHVDLGYFGVARIPINRGRPFGREDRAFTPPVGVIDENAARRFWPGQEAIGRRFRYSPYVPWITVVGIAGSRVHPWSGRSNRCVPALLTESARWTAGVEPAQPRALKTRVVATKRVQHDASPQLNPQNFHPRFQVGGASNENILLAEPRPKKHSGCEAESHECPSPHRRRRTHTCVSGQVPGRVASKR
jgi:hypothetical protein